MKKIMYTILGVTLLGITLHSCNLDVTPTTSLSSDVVFENTDNADKVLNGTWAYLWDTYFTYQNPGWTCLLRVGDALGDDVAVQPGKYGYIAHYSFTNISSTSSTTGTAVWTLAYKVIDNTNNLITKIDAASGDDDVKARIKAQAEALRGYIYLNLATYYSFAYAKDPNALSVPIYTEPTTIATKGKPRSALKDVYKQSETDLLNAYNAIGSYDRSGLKYKIDKNVIAGLLARLYLQTEQWDKAQQYADEAQADYSWMSKSDYLKGFNDNNNPEWIWGHGQTAEQNTASYTFNFLDVSSSSSYYYSFMADPYFKDFFDTNDVRYQLFQWDTSRYLGGLMYKKFTFRSDGTGDIVLMRKAEMVLIEAEAYAEQGLLSKAIDKLNDLRTQRGANTPDLSQLPQSQLIEEILIERRKELWGEGFALSDILRTQKAVSRKAVPTGTILQIDGSPVIVKGHQVTIKGHTVTNLPVGNGTNFVPNSPFYLFAIPATEVANNPNL